MSTLEKSIIKQIRVQQGNKAPKVFVQGTRAYRGISTVNADNASIIRYDIDLIKQDLINHFHIRKGEKVSDPEFGTIIWDSLFEPFTELLKDKIIKDVTTIINYDPRVSVDSIVIDTYESGLLIECSLMYLPYNVSEKLRLTFDENNGLLNN